MSRQRNEILLVLRDLKCHPTADDIFQAVRQKLPHISLGTVYRNLEILSTSGKVKKVQLGGSQMRFDNCTEDHVHIHCVECGRVDDLPIDTVNPCQDEIGEKIGYKIIGLHIEFVGICPACQQDEGGEAA
jgi:Fur family ferric uptake transcriptional regulator